MRDRNNQNGSSLKPYSGILYKLKVSLFANKLTNWYFQRQPCHIGAFSPSIALLSS